MNIDEEIIQGVTAIYKFVYDTPGVHRNIIRKKLIAKGKIASKEKFYKYFEGMRALDKITLEKENVYLNKDLIKVGVIQKDRHSAYIVTPSSKKRYPVSKSVAAGYKNGELLDVIVEYTGKETAIIILGRNQLELERVKSPDVINPIENPENNIVVQPTVNNKQTQKPITLENENMVLGRVVKLSHDNLVFIPNKKNLSTRQIPILNNKEELSNFQDKICIMNLVNKDFPLGGGHIVEVKGDAGNPIHEYDAIAESYGAIMSWSDNPAFQKEIETIPTAVDINNINLITEEQAKYLQKGNVVDLRHLPFLTIDPATCKDMDDAIYSTYDQNGNIVVYTAVANVTKYVDLNSEIGQRYVNAGFTIYAPNKAYNILPTQLSTGICSLNPNEDRSALVVKSVLDAKTGKVLESHIYDALINSKQKYSYEEAQEIVDDLDTPDDKDYLQYAALTNTPLTNEEQILMNYYAAQVIKKGFEERRMIRFNSGNEREIKFDNSLAEVVDISLVPHLQYHEVIEEFMITANEATAKYAKDNNLENIYRVHDEPSTRKIERATEFFSIMGIDFQGDLSAQGTINILDSIKNTANEEVINNFLIKMQQRAVYRDHLYSSENKAQDPEWVGQQISHYALQSPHYSHSTAPIRRVVDYVTHYNILANIHQTEPISRQTMLDIIENANERQLQVDQAEKDFEDISSVFYCEKHIGEMLSGRITKIRMAALEEGYDDEIIVIVKSDEKGISAEIPLSQVIGRQTRDCSLSRLRCAVYDGKGNVILTLCKPIDFIIAQADRKTMRVIGKTTKNLVKNAEIRENANKYFSNASYVNRKRKVKRIKRLENNKKFNIKNRYNDDEYER